MNSSSGTKNDKERALVYLRQVAATKEILESDSSEIFEESKRIYLENLDVMQVKMLARSAFDNLSRQYPNKFNFSFLNHKQDSGSIPNNLDNSYKYSTSHPEGSGKGHTQDKEHFAMQDVGPSPNRESCYHNHHEGAKSPANTDLYLAENDYSAQLLVIPILGALLIIFWVGSMRLIDNPASYMNLILLSVLLGTSYFAYKEQMAVSKFLEVNHSPMTQAVMMFIFWPIMYPGYMYSRKNHVFKSHLLAGIFITLFFCFAWLDMNHAIHRQGDKVRQQLNEAQQNLQNLRDKLRRY